MYIRLLANSPQIGKVKQIINLRNRTTVFFAEVFKHGALQANFFWGILAVFSRPFFYLLL